jgi:D-sedoheptulose 7-phosphate isomerase
MSTQAVLDRLAGSLEALGTLRALAGAIDAAREALADSIANGGTLYTCGNGGSAAQAMHLSEELIGRYNADRPPIRSICLNADPSALTCITNDMGWEEVFARQVEALVGKGDVLLAFSTSGNSPNVVRALDAATARGATTIAFLGKGGGKCAEPSRCQHPLVVDSRDTAHIQEAHLVLLHLFCERFEPPTPA